MAGRVMDAAPLACSLILDRVHVHDVAVRLAHRAIGVERLLLVTDCVAAMGMPDGEYRLGNAPVFLAGGVVRNAAGDHAGSALDMFGAARNFLEVVPGTGPWSLARVAARNPARAIGARGFGEIAPGAVACFTVLGTDGSLRALDLR
jgi:N-acetylglucosamine-6-phosphate deacetylase